MTDIAINEALFDDVGKSASYITFYPHRGNDDRVEGRTDGREDMTSKEISQRLKDAGFESEHTHWWRIWDDYDYHNDIHNEICDFTKTKDKDNILDAVFIPAYSAETLFEWLRENENLYLSDSDGIFGFRIVGFKPTSSIYKTNLADMFGEAVIWIESNTQADREANGIKEQS